MKVIICSFSLPPHCPHHATVAVVVPDGVVVVGQSQPEDGHVPFKNIKANFDRISFKSF